MTNLTNLKLRAMQKARILILRIRLKSRIIILQIRLLPNKPH